MNQLQQTVEALDSATRLLEAGLEPALCPHDGRYGRSAECLTCDRGANCDWLTQVTWLAPLDRQSPEVLQHLLSLAHSCIECGVSLEERHDCSRCPCPTCRWLRRTRKLL